ncbi:methionyl-tRNA formyltransferase [Elysia marginata]|uniref:Methionyl-tRNA formyltransferase n=1 Tax=Elysia marginata TaxID=1093978 RepID=A0AAV4FV68_9GAST|nr:methionyl-tRNA formyltransferase [Elysia marginata]
MVDYAKTIENREKRNEVVKSIIGVMGNLCPHLRDVPEFQHKLWDQLFIIADFDLDVDTPYEKISREAFEKRPDPLDYPQCCPKYRFYGNNLLKMIDKINTLKEEESKKQFIVNIANLMKKSYVTWNKGTVDDNVILDHLKELSNNGIDDSLLPKELEIYYNQKEDSYNSRQAKNNSKKGGLNGGKKYKKYKSQTSQ